MILAAIVEQGRCVRVCGLAMAIAAGVICRAGQIGQRALRATHTGHEEDVSIVAHGLDLSQENRVIAAGILSRDAGVNEGYAAIEDRRACGGGRVASVAEVIVAFLRGSGKAIRERLLLLA